MPFGQKFIHADLQNALCSLWHYNIEKKKTKKSSEFIVADCYYAKLKC
jgi:hypothetical protein